MTRITVQAVLTMVTNIAMAGPTTMEIKSTGIVMKKSMITMKVKAKVIKNIRELILII